MVWSLNMRDKEKSYGLCECFLGRRIDLCAGPDSNGKDKNAARKNYGVASL